MAGNTVIKVEDRAITFKLDKVLEVKGVTVGQLGKMTGINPHRIKGYIENTVQMVNLSYIERIAQALGTDYDDLIKIN